MPLKPKEEIQKIQKNHENCCQFCKILTKCNQENSQTVIYKDDFFFAFHDIDKSSAREHILVCTTEHIETALQIPRKQMLYRMREVGKLILNEICGQYKCQISYRFGFHLRPYNSIDHVHLHCFVLPFSSYVKDKIVYGKLLTSIEQVAQRLELTATPKL